MSTCITTRQRQRDEHLRSDEFFHVAKYPAITFQSTSYVPAGERQYELRPPRPGACRNSIQPPVSIVMNLV
ncbi:YceI family protein [Paenibacillus agri]|uniref:YceI family protein n=1 Tax=Paenibacillus agri TaxID=2744309 RepID=UPI001FEC3183|nr:YceI family protein [Paenibacillus agri]